MTEPKYLGIISPSEIQQLKLARKEGRTHPVADLALAEPGDCQTATNTEQSARTIGRKNATWLAGLRSRLLDEKDFTNASSALGEIRAYGALLETWMTVGPVPLVDGKAVSPEFEVSAGDGSVIVEVHSKQPDKAQARAIATNAREHETKHRSAVEKARKTGTAKPVTTVSELVVTPFGAPALGKAGDSVLTNMISRVTSIKEAEHQADVSKPFVLWLDFQDPTVWPLSLLRHLSPLHTGREGHVATGGLWYGLYGRKEDPMIESDELSYKTCRMLHHGRFSMPNRTHGGPTRVSAVVYSLPRAIVLMENPAAVMPIPARWRASLLRAPFFRLELSMVEWEVGLVAAQVGIARLAVAVAARALGAFDPASL